MLRHFPVEISHCDPFKFLPVHRFWVKLLGCCRPAATSAGTSTSKHPTILLDSFMQNYNHLLSSARDIKMVSLTGMVILPHLRAVDERRLMDDS